MRIPKWLDVDDIPEPPAGGPAILVYDIETAPIAVYVWSEWKANALRVIREQYVLSIAYRWHGSDDPVRFVGIIDDPAFRPDYGYGKPRKHVDRHVIARMWHLFDRADVVVAHNGDRFDQRKIKARFAVHGAPPASPFESIDTLKVARKEFGFTSNRLDRLGQQLGLGRKVTHSGIDLWFRCMAGEPEAWAEMETYNLRDVDLLDDVFVRLRPFAGPIGTNARAFTDPGGRPIQCTKPGCGGMRIISKGMSTPTKAGLRYQRWMCTRCGSYSRARYAEREHTAPGDRIK